MSEGVGWDGMQDRARQLDELYSTWAPLAYRRILKFFPPQEAEDVLHELFLRLHEQFDTFRGESSPATWLFRITTNHCLNKVRNEKRRRDILAQEARAWTARTQDSSAESAFFLKELWALLPEELCALGIYYFVDGLTQSEIAVMLGVSRRTVGNRLEDLKNKAREATS